MKVLVLGASGFVGLPTCEAVCRAGHIVYGQTRSASSAVLLETKEIIPVVCDPLTDEGRKVWGKVAAVVDVVVDLVVITGLEGTLATYRNYVASISNRPKGGVKPTFIAAEGHWTLTRGMGGVECWTDERQPPSGQMDLVKRRVDLSKEILENEDINGIAVHPPMVYGGSGSWFAKYMFEPALAASKTEDKIFGVLLDDTARLTTVHRDDLADLILRVAERAFVGSNPQSERMRDIIDAIVRVSGCKGYDAQLPDANDPVGQAWVSTTLQKPSLGAALTGWYPHKMGLVDGMDQYWRSFLASKGEGA